MRNDGPSYEDELDRMRARQQRRAAARKQGAKGQEPASQRRSSQGWDDTIIYRKPGAGNPYQ
ncbi:MAG: hypothetical protein Q4C73_09635, partial [Eubacteriales bacterium]|nr:hypothetical protein [Eubacteriales bacterium]